MGLSREYIRSIFDQQQHSDDNGETNLFSYMEYETMTPDTLLIQNSKGIKRAVLGFLLKHKETLKKFPMIREIGKKYRYNKTKGISMESVYVVDIADCLALYWEDCLRECYRRLLGRELDEPGRIAHRTLVTDGASNQVLAYSIIVSPEFNNRCQVKHSQEYKKAYNRYFRNRKIKKIPILGRIISLFALSGQVKTLYAQNVDIIDQNTKLAAMIDTQKQQIIETITNEGQRQIEENNKQRQWQIEENNKQRQWQMNEDDNQRQQLEKTIHNHTDELTTIMYRVSEKQDIVVSSLNYIGHEGTALSGFKGGVTGVIADGFIFGVPSEEWGLAMFLSRYGHFEVGSELFFESLLKPDMTILDLGANLGMYTLRALRKGCRVYSYEPTPNTFRILNQNIKVNGFEESGMCHAVMAAVSDHEGTARFYVEPDVCGQNSLFEAGSDNKDYLEVKTVTIDDERHKYPSVDVIKIDIEGGEYAALVGMKETIRENPKVQIIMEFAPSMIKKAGHEPKELLGIIKDYCFEIYEIDESTSKAKEVLEEQLLNSYSTNIYLRRER